MYSENYFSPGTFFLSFPIKLKQKKKKKKGSSLHLLYLKVTYIMARTLIRMVCPPKFREGFNIILFVLHDLNMMVHIVSAPSGMIPKPWWTS